MSMPIVCTGVHDINNNLEGNSKLNFACSQPNLQWLLQ